MSIKSVFLIISLLLIEFSVKIKGNDDDKAGPSQKPSDIVELTKNAHETLQSLQMIQSHWNELNDDDQMEIWRLHQQLVNFAKTLSQPINPTTIVQHQNLLSGYVIMLRNCLRTVIQHRQALSSVSRTQAVIQEYKALMAVSEQLKQNYVRVKLRWTELHEKAQNIIKQGHLQIQETARKIKPTIQTQPLTLEEIIRHRQTLYQPIAGLNDYLTLILGYQEARRQQGTPTPAPKINSEQPQIPPKRPNEIDLNRQGDKRKPPGNRRP